MKTIICSKNTSFHSDCRMTLQIWAQVLGADLEIEQIEDLKELPREEKDVLFLDVDGFQSEEWKVLELVQRECAALFICSQDPKTAIQSYRFRPTAFLGKPLSPATLDNAMSRCVSLWHGKLQSLELTESRSRLKVPLCNIFWVRAMGRCSLLHGIHRDMKIGESMNELVEILPKEKFIRCQRSFLVNLYHVKSSDGRMLYMTDGTTVSIGRGMQAEVREALQQFQTQWNCTSMVTVDPNDSEKLMADNVDPNRRPSATKSSG